MISLRYIAKSAVPFIHCPSNELWGHRALLRCLTVCYTVRFPRPSIKYRDDWKTDLTPESSLKTTHCAVRGQGLTSCCWPNSTEQSHLQQQKQQVCLVSRRQPAAVIETVMNRLISCAVGTRPLHPFKQVMRHPARRQGCVTSWPSVTPLVSEPRLVPPSPPPNNWQRWTGSDVMHPARRQG